MYLRISLKTVILIMVLILPLIFRKIAQTPVLVLGALGSSTILVLILAFHVEAPFVSPDQEDYEQEPPAPL